MSMLSMQIDRLRELATRYDELQVDAVKAVTMPSNMGSILRDAADTIWKLRDDLQRANADNAELRNDAELLRAMLSQKRTEKQCHVAENAKLRELVRDLYCLAYPSTVEWEVADETYDKYSPCEKCHELHGGKSPCASTAKDMTEECCAPIQANVVADCLRELGVEVD